jgi:hypothetical protein
MHRTHRPALAVFAASCGSAGEDLSVKVYEILNDAMCLTVCSICRDSGRMPSIMLSTHSGLCSNTVTTLLE